jgi:hypothetical protein
MTISSPNFTRLQDGIKAVDDIRVRGPLNVALAWLSGGLVTQLNSHFGDVSQSISAALQAFRGTANTFTAAQTISGAATTLFTVTGADDGAGGGPFAIIRRTSGTPAANDTLGFLFFQGRNSTSTDTNYVFFGSRILDKTNGSEDGQGTLNAAVAGAGTAIVTYGPGVQIGAPTGGDPGFGSVNVDGVYLTDGNQVVGPRITGYGDPFGAVSRATISVTTVTTAQLASFVAAIYTDLKTHGLIGT